MVSAVATGSQAHKLATWWPLMVAYKSLLGPNSATLLGSLPTPFVQVGFTFPLAFYLGSYVQSDPYIRASC